MSETKEKKKDGRATTGALNLAKARAAKAAKKLAELQQGDIIDEVVVFDLPEENVTKESELEVLRKQLDELKISVQKDKEERAARKAAKAQAKESAVAPSAPAPTPAPAKKPLWAGLISI